MEKRLAQHVVQTKSRPGQDDLSGRPLRVISFFCSSKYYAETPLIATRHLLIGRILTRYGSTCDYWSQSRGQSSNLLVTCSLSWISALSTSVTSESVRLFEQLLLFVFYSEAMGMRILGSGVTRHQKRHQRRQDNQAHHTRRKIPELEKPLAVVVS